MGLSTTKPAIANTQPLFATLLPPQVDPEKELTRQRLIAVLTSQGEILPSANSPRGKLWRLVNTPGSSLQECAEVLQLDSALAARVLRVANSGAYALQAESVSAALLHLGMKFVREQVFNAGIFKQYSGWTLPPEWDLFWLRNIFVARLSERTASSYGPTDGSEYLAGLIHDMGWLFFATYFPEDFVALTQGDEPIPEAEATYFPISHATVSAAIAARSRLPRRAVDAILLHHDTHMTQIETPVLPRDNPCFLGIILRLGDALADVAGMDIFGACNLTLEEIQDGPESRWLAKFGQTIDWYQMAEEELRKSQEIFEVYFSNRSFH